MRQKWWIELFSDYECEIRYHPGKANVVADALSRKERVKPRRVRAMAMTIQSGIESKEDESLYFMDRIWVLLVGDVRMVIMDEAHKSRYSVHSGADKMYHDLLKLEHQRPSGLLLQPEIPEWKWDKINIDLITKLPIARVDYFGSRWAIYFTLLENGTESVRDKIRLEYYLSSSDGWKNYALAQWLESCASIQEVLGSTPICGLLSTSAATCTPRGDTWTPRGDTWTPRSMLRGGPDPDPDMTRPDPAHDQT
ncbi:hypothetical protein Tco_0613107 [Tanacetum coccineum]